MSVSGGTPKLSLLSLMKASVDGVNGCGGDNGISWPVLDESNKSNTCVVLPQSSLTAETQEQKKLVFLRIVER